MGLTTKNQGTEGFQQCILKAPQTIDLSPPCVDRSVSELQIEGSCQSEFVMKVPFLRVPGALRVTGGPKGILPPG